ncbi:phosphoribosyltransferase [Acuticoccus kandeliae]|uniref:phosphoribosyltransferase n=1 Tax=Acuticoccus kandeliae TaxID=2073160 RepID=UPI000D3EA672|nr:phosphoribosyltransferase [Acuticoccus kandeliae]
MYFKDRHDAGRWLAARLEVHEGTNALVLALPRGGVPVAYEVAKALELPLDILLVRKLGVPGHEEFAMGAIANSDVEVLNQRVIDSLDIPKPMVDAVIMREREELQRRNEHYRGGAPAPDLKHRSVIIVDDGIATGADMRAAVGAAEALGAAHIVVAAPVASREAVTALGKIADDVVTLATPEPFGGVGLYYRDFSQTSDAEVQRLLADARALSA